MSFMEGLLSTEAINAVATSLAAVTRTDSSETNGSVLYRSYCEGCHGSLATTTKWKPSGRTSQQIQSALEALAPMQFLSVLSTTQIDAISTTISP